MPDVLIAAHATALADAIAVDCMFSGIDAAILKSQHGIVIKVMVEMLTQVSLQPALSTPTRCLRNVALVG